MPYAPAWRDEIGVEENAVDACQFHLMDILEKISFHNFQRWRVAKYLLHGSGLKKIQRIYGLEPNGSIVFHGIQSEVEFRGFIEFGCGGG